MIRFLAALLLFAYAFVPPGICACRLQDLLFAEHADDACPDDDDHECDCPRIQHDCTTSAASAVERSDGANCAFPPADSAAAPTTDERSLHAPTPSSWPAAPPLYLILRALLI